MRIMLMAVLSLFAMNGFTESRFERFDRFFLGGGFNTIDANVLNDIGQAARFTTVEFLVGYKYSGFLSTDVRVGFGITNENLDVEVDNNGTISNETAETSVGQHASIYWRPETANEIAKIYGLLGASIVQVTQSVDSLSVEETESRSGVSYGGGVGFAMYEDWNLNFEYRVLLDTEEDEFTSVNMSLDYRF